jgi:hypothetical protein
MSTAIIASAVARLEALGMDSESILSVVKEMLSADRPAATSDIKRSSAALRQERYREKERAKASQSITRDVTRDDIRDRNSDVTCDACDVTSDVPSRAYVRAEPELTNLEIYPEKKETKNNVGLPVTGVTAGNVVGLFEQPLSAEPKSHKRKPTNQKLAYSGPFEILWETFPFQRNASKAKAFEAYQRLSNEDRELALDGALVFLEFWKKRRLRYPDYDGPHLSTWLNDRRFESALEVRQQ